ncbi:FtsX-like permease family protein [Pirellula sp. SH-Sr6A]|nr:FtsX-like permease family protein [Pirellula sp. SH-Sr6A]
MGYHRGSNSNPEPVFLQGELPLVSSVFRRTPVALLNLLSHPARAAVSLGGVSFALLLIFMQLGFRGAVGNTATIVYGKLSGEVVIRSFDYVHLYEPRTIDRHWLKTLASHPLVDRVDPFFIMLQKWQNPPRNTACANAPPDGSFRTVGMMGMEVDRPVLEVEDAVAQLDALKDPDAMLVDQATRAEYGPQDCKAFGERDLGLRAELGGRASRIAGTFRLGTGLATNGAVLVSDVAFSRRAPFDTRQRVSLGLIHLKPGIEPSAAAKELTNWLSERDPNASQSVQILSMKEQMEWERGRWLNETPIGMIFTMGVLISFIIGAAIVYMVLATDVASRISEFATMKAMGYSEWYVSGIVLQQAWMLAFGGYIVSTMISLLLYQLTVALSGIPTFMTWPRMGGVLILALLMCSFSGVLAMRKLWRADPASLF